MAGPPIPGFVMKRLARQLSGPSGLFGRVVARMLNKNNARSNTAAVEALGLRGGETVADVGFGGGIGLDVLLAATGDDGVVHGVELSTDMLARARKTQRAAVASERLVLHEAPMGALPFDSDALDGWISLNTIYFVADLAGGLAELSRVLAPDGRGVLGISDPEWMATTPLTQHGFRARPLDDVVAALRVAGLDAEVQPLDGGDGAPPFKLLICTPA